MFFLLFIQYFIQIDYHILLCNLIFHSAMLFSCFKTSQPGPPPPWWQNRYLLSTACKSFPNLALASLLSTPVTLTCTQSRSRIQLLLLPKHILPFPISASSAYAAEDGKRNTLKVKGGLSTKKRNQFYDCGQLNLICLKPSFFRYRDAVSFVRRLWEKKLDNIINKHNA